MAKPGPKPKFTKASLLKAIRGSGGTIAGIARKAKVNWNTAKRAVAQYAPESLEAMEEEKEARIDDAEDQLAAAVKIGDPWAVKFTLATIGKKRGFTERVEHSGPDGEPLSVEVKLVKPK